jgi:hypothetical protein
MWKTIKSRNYHLPVYLSSLSRSFDTSKADRLEWSLINFSDDSKRVRRWAVGLREGHEAR